MTAIKTIFGYVHCGMALIVAIQFLVSPMYGGDLNGTVWDAVSILMAIGAVAALVFAVMRMREVGFLFDWGSTLMLIASLTLFLLFFRLWFASYVFGSAETPALEFSRLMWYGIEVLFVLVNLFVGRYLLRGEKATN